MIDLSRHKNKRYPKKYIHQNHSLQCDKTQQNYTIYIYTGRLTSAIPNLSPPPSFLDRSRPLPTSITKRFQTQRGVGQAWFNSIILNSVTHPSIVDSWSTMFKQFHVKKKKLSRTSSSQFSTNGFPSNLAQLTSAIPDSINGGCKTTTWTIDERKP